MPSAEPGLDGAGLGWDPGWEQGALPTGLAPPLLKVEATWRDTAWGGGCWATSQRVGRRNWMLPSHLPFLGCFPPPTGSLRMKSGTGGGEKRG